MNSEKKNLNETEATEVEAQQPLKLDSVPATDDTSTTNTNDSDIPKGSRTEEHEPVFKTSTQAEQGFMDKSIITEPPEGELE